MTKGYVLVIEDTDEWRHRLKRLLVREGYQVEEASTFDQAMELLRARPFHLALVDISLRYKDESDESGMHILQAIKEEGLDRVVQTIVISGYGTRRRMRRAFVDYDVADFIPKDEFDVSEFLSLVNRVFDKKVRVNPDLQILPANFDFPSLFVNMVVGGERVRKKNSSKAALYAEELKELLRRLFYAADSVVVSPVTKGFSGAGILRIQAVYKNSGVSAPMIVKFGDKVQIEREHRHHKNYVESFIGAGRTSSIVANRYTNHLGGIVYQFLGTDVGSWIAFADYYRANSEDKLIDVLRDLFYVTMANWYANRSTIEPLPLVQTYLSDWNVRTLAQLEQYVFTGKLKRYQEMRNIMYLSGLEDIAISNPFTILNQNPFIFLTTHSITHGDLNLNNVLIDNADHTWLIDFYSTGKGHILRDITQLEAHIKFQLLGEAPLQDRYQLEKVLAEDKRFSQIVFPRPIPQTLPKSVHKAFQIVSFLRRVAADLVRNQRSEDFAEYQVALGMHSLNLARMLSLTELQRLHALLCAAVALDSTAT